MVNVQLNQNAVVVEVVSSRRASSHTNHQGPGQSQSIRLGLSTPTPKPSVMEECKSLSEVPSHAVAVQQAGDTAANDVLMGPQSKEQLHQTNYLVSSSESHKASVKTIACARGHLMVPFEPPSRLSCSAGCGAVCRRPRMMFG